MPVPYEYDAEKGIIQVRPSGDLRLNDIGERLKRVAADDTIQPGAVEFIHLTDVTNIQYDSRESSLIPDMYRPLQEKKQIRATFFIGGSDFHYGAARMVQTWFDIHGLGKNVMVVRSEDEALRMLDELSV